MAADGSTGEKIDLVFPVLGRTIPRDSAYAVYGAVSRIVPSVHAARDIGLFPLGGQSAGDALLQITDRSVLRIRLPAGALPTVLPLAGKPLELDGHRIRLGVPTVSPLIPAPTLVSSRVLIKLHQKTDPADAAKIVSPDGFLAAAAKQLAALEILGQPHLQLTRTGPHTGQPRRRVLNVKGKLVVGYAMVVDSLTAEESIRLQEQGLGGRRLMGCGLFLGEGKEAARAL